MIALPIARPIAAAIATALFSQNSGAYSGPSLRLGFSENTYLMGAIGKPPSAYEFDSLITFTRASGGGRFNASGVYEYLGNDVPRITYDPVTLKRLGQLIEEQRTNLLLRSTLEGGTAGTVGSGAVAPTGWSFTFAGGTVAFPVSALGTISVATTKTVNTDRPFIQQIISVLASTSYVLSARVTSSSGTMKLGDLCAWASLPAGATQTYYKNGVLTTASAVEVLVYGDVISSVLTVSTTAGTVQARVGLGTAGDPGVTGTCTLTMPMVEQATSPGSYIPTTTTQVTRAADVASVNTLSPWYNATEGTLVVKLSAYSGQTGFRNVVTMHAGAATQLYVSMETMGITVSGVTSTAPINTSRPVPLGIAGSYKVGEPVRASKNGSSALVAVNNVAAALPFTQMAIGRSTFYGGDLFSGVISSITYYPRVIDVQQASA